LERLWARWVDTTKYICGQNCGRRARCAAEANEQHKKIIRALKAAAPEWEFEQINSVVGNLYIYIYIYIPISVLPWCKLWWFSLWYSMG